MSCRVLNREIESFVFNSICDYARSIDMKKVVAEYIPSNKNGLVKNLLSELQFSRVGEVNDQSIQVYEYILDNVIKKNHFINL